jgi:PleD family two-component response regulator
LLFRALPINYNKHQGSRFPDKNVLIDAADKAMYKAKQSGKNKVCVLTKE